MSEELKPCPVCGWKLEYDEKDGEDDYGQFEVEIEYCPNCGYTEESGGRC